VTGPPVDRLGGDHGAAVAEFALLLPFFSLMVFGLLEFGNAYRRKSTLESVVASATRVDVQLGKDRMADAEALRSISSGLSSYSDLTIQRVVVWKANGATTGPLCVTGAGVSGSCNVYTAAQVADTSGTGFANAASCTGNWDVSWCPLNRSDTDLAQDYVGVYIEVQYRAKTRVVTSQYLTLKAWSVMRIEPPFGAN
jgi:Flp pilus assembly protein TadG